MKENGNKYKVDETLPLEYAIYDSVSPTISPILYEKFGVTPNMVTTITNILSIYIIYLFINKKYILAAGLVIVRQIMDGLDGYIARKYNLQSDFGSKYDQYSDRVFGITLFVLLFKEYFKKSPVTAILVSLPIILIMYMNAKKHECLKRNLNVCKNDQQRHELLKFTRPISPLEINIYVGMLISGLKYL